VASHHDVLRAWLRALRCQHVSHPVGDDSWGIYFPRPGALLEPASGNDRKSFCWNTFDGCRAVFDVSHGENLCRKSGSRTSYSAGRTTGHVRRRWRPALELARFARFLLATEKFRSGAGLPSLDRGPSTPPVRSTPNKLAAK